MKNLLTCALLMLGLMIVGNVNAQKIALGGGLGGAKLTGDLGEGGSFGLQYLLEGKYFFTDQLAAGLEYNGNAIAFGNDGGLFGVSAYGATLYLAKGEYFLTKGTVQPYVGLGLGLGQISTPEITISDGSGGSSTIPSESSFNLAVSPRLGVQISSFALEFAYNFSGKTPKSELQNTSVADMPFNFFNITVKYNYLYEW